MLAVRAPLSLSCLGVLCTAALVGCAPDSTSESPDPNGAGETHAFLRVERTVGAEGNGVLSEGRASATFLRTVTASGATERPLVAARLVGALLDVPTAPGCAPRLAAEPAVPLRTLSPVDLVHAGDVSLQAGAVLTPLAARAYPDVAHLVSGIVYTSPDVSQELLPQHGVARFRASGSSAVPAFEAALVPPEHLGFTSVGGHAIAALGASTDNPSQARRGPLSVTWMPAPIGVPSADSTNAEEADETRRVDRDAEYLDITSSRGVRYRCVPSEPGRVVVPPAAIGDADEVSIVLHRVRTESFRAPGIATGTLQIDAASALVVQLVDTDG